MIILQNIYNHENNSINKKKIDDWFIKPKKFHYLKRTTINTADLKKNIKELKFIMIQRPPHRMPPLWHCERSEEVLRLGSE